MLKLPQKIRACLLAGAIGDALGSPHEGATAPIRPGPLGSLTDDTQLTLATCEAIVTSGGVDPQSIASTMLRWWEQRRLTALGSSTLTALHGLRAGGHWALVGRRGEFAAGNGAAMRIAPLAFMLDPQQTVHRRLIADVCRITHHSDEAFAGALAHVVALRLAAAGQMHTPHFLGQVAQPLPDSKTRDVLLALDGHTPATLSALAAQTGTSGHTPESVPLSIAAAPYVAHHFEEGLQQLVSLGGDCDTIASMAAQLAAIGTDHWYPPSPWMDHLSRYPYLNIIDDFALFVEQARL